MLRRPLCATALAALLIAGCGGSAHSSSSTSSSAPTSSTSAATTAHGTSTATVSAGPSTTSATTSARPPEVPKNRVPAHPLKHSKPTAPNTNVRIPAAFIIRAGGAVTPPLISAPANVTIQLQLHNEDSASHRVQLTVANFAALTVAAHGSTTTEVTGARKGTYRLLVDGAAKARIVVGAVPGP